MSRFVARWVVLLACFAAPACSLMGLGEYELFECNAGDACTDRNKGREGECLQYYCTAVGRGCEPKPRDDDGDDHPNAGACGTLGDAGVALDCDDSNVNVHPGEGETCDGLDNDCNGYVDEGVLPDSDEALELNEANVSQLSHASALDGTLHLMLTREPLATTHVAIQSNGERHARELFVSGTRCTAPPGAAAQPCNIDQLAIAATADVLVGTGIHRSSCDEGQLRVGAAAPERALELGDGTLGPIALGIDVEHERSCSLSTACPGASDPAVALLSSAVGAQSTEGLVVWLAPFAESSAECLRSTESRVLGLGLTVEAGAAGAVSRLRATSEGAAEQLAARNASGPPAVVSFSSADAGSGYLVAYPSAQGIELLVVPRLLGRTSLGRVALEATVDARRPSRVAITVADGSQRGLAVAFQTEDGGPPAIQLVPLVLEQGEALKLGADGAAVTLELGGALVSGPALVYAPEGFTPAEQLRPGGWSVLWVESVADGSGDAARLRAARISESDRHVIEQVTLAHGDITDVFTYSKHNPGRSPSRRYGYVTRDAVYLDRLSCEID